MPKYNSFWTKYTDKVLHFSIGLFICMVVYTIAQKLFQPHLWWWVAQLTVFIVAISKELRDMAKTLQWQKFDIPDIIATQSGALVAMFLLLFLKNR